MIQDQQETYMDAAWNQIGDILAAQQRIRYGQFGVLASTVWYDRHLVTTMNASTQQGLMLLAPLNKRVLHDGVTIHHLYSQSLVQPTMTSGALRRVARPRGRRRTAHLLGGESADEDARRCQRRPRVGSPTEGHHLVATDTGVADAGLSGHVPAWLIGWLRRFRWLPFVPLALAVLIAIILRVGGAERRHHRCGRGTGPDRYRTHVAVDDGVAVDGAGKIPLDHISDGLAQLSPAPNFVIQDPTYMCTAGNGGSDSAEAFRFKRALEQTGHLIGIANAAGTPPEAHQPGAVAATAIAGVEPRGARSRVACSPGF